MRNDNIAHLGAHFGRIDRPQTALDKWLWVKNYLLAGRTPPTDTDGLSVMDLCNHSLTSRHCSVEGAYSLAGNEGKAHAHNVGLGRGNRERISSRFAARRPMLVKSML